MEDCSSCPYPLLAQLIDGRWFLRTETVAVPDAGVNTGRGAALWLRPDGRCVLACQVGGLPTVQINAIPKLTVRSGVPVVLLLSTATVTATGRDVEGQRRRAMDQRPTSETCTDAPGQSAQNLQARGRGSKSPAYRGSGLAT